MMSVLSLSFLPFYGILTDTCYWKCISCHIKTAK